VIDISNYYLYPARLTPSLFGPGEGGGGAGVGALVPSRHDGDRFLGLNVLVAAGTSFW
jgi:hypothetical protein